MPSSAGVIQRRVMRVRGNRDGPQLFRSSLPELAGQTYDSFEAATAAETGVLAQRQAQEAQHQAPQQFQLQPQIDGPAQPHNDLSATMHARPVSFGPLTTPSGDVTMSQASAIAGGTAVHPHPSGRQTLYSGRNTYAGVFSSLSVGGSAISTHIHDHQGGATSPDTLDEADAASFHTDHLFQQGRPPDHVQMPAGDTRTSVHAEAQAAQSQAYQGAVEQNAQDMSMMIDTMLGDEVNPFDLPTDPSQEQLEDLAQALPFTVGTTIATNRTSCRGSSGYTGGCTQEMADQSAHYHQGFAQHVSPAQAFVQQAVGTAGFGMSSASPYSRQGNPTIMTGAGTSVSAHNPLNTRTGQIGQVPPTMLQYEQWGASAADPAPPQASPSTPVDPQEVDMVDATGAGDADMDLEENEHHG